MQYVMDARNADQKPMPEKLLEVQEAREDVGMAEGRLPASFRRRKTGPNEEPTESADDRARRLAKQELYFGERKEQHNQALDEYEAKMDTLAMYCEGKCQERVKLMKQRTVQNDETINKLLAPTEDKEILEDLELAIEARKEEVDLFGEDLERIEVERKREMEALQRELVKRMTEAAHEVRGQMERIVERESLKASELLLTNGAAQADVLARLRVASQEKRKECKTRWTEGMLLWRRLRHHHAIDVCMERIMSREFRNPVALVNIFRDLRAQQRLVFEKRFAMATRAIDVDIEQIREADAKNLEDQINSLNDEAQEAFDRFAAQLATLKNHLKKSGHRMIEELVQDLESHDARTEWKGYETVRELVVADVQPHLDHCH